MKHQQIISFALLFFASLVTFGLAENISCPVLQCTEPDESGAVDYDLCWKVEESQPMKIIRAYQCDWYIANEKSNLEIDAVSTCDFSTATSEFAWVDEQTQGITKDEERATVVNSQFNRKKTEAYCREVASLNQQLSNGRTCQSSYQCLNGVCEDSKCVGLSIGQNCHSHQDCSEGLFCEKSNSWPWTYSCAKLRTSYQICIEDTECQAGSFCWYASADKVRDDTIASKQCLPYFSQSSQLTIGWKNLPAEGTWEAPKYEDLKFNGQYCEYGLAFPINQYASNCTQVDKVEFAGKEIKSPYKCNPRDNEEKCRFYYNTTVWDGTTKAESDFFETPCQCSMDGDSGFCASVLGTEDFAEGASKIKNLYQANLCHTNDRGDYRAMRESCCLANENEWEEAATASFKLNNWPYVNAEDTAVRDCFYYIDKNSPSNLIKELASQLTTSVAVLLGVAAVLS